jgi:NAD-dependent deacetylase
MFHLASIGEAPPPSTVLPPAVLQAHPFLPMSGRPEATEFDGGMDGASRVVDPTQADTIARLRELLADARAIVPFTGAGISTESGVPDFRTPGSPWMQNKPIPFQAFVASAEARREAWTRKFRMDSHMSGVSPNAGHLALARLVAGGRAPGIVTQNIDGLHQLSGVPQEKIVELHGNGTYAACLDCAERHELREIEQHFEAHGHAPPCRHCSGLLKSATISFGQAMPQGEMTRAQALMQACDLCLVLGSSLVVYPAAALPVIAKRAGAKLAIVNREPTELDGIADCVVRGGIGDVLEQVLGLKPALGIETPSRPGA